MVKQGKTGKLTRILYGSGAVAFGVKDNGFTTFLMIFYNQVLGLSAFYTGLAILIALAVDALSHPYVGHVSDHCRSRLGRRHPFMYGAVLPIALSYYFLWNVPEAMPQSALFLYLVVTAVLVRLLITFFEVPNSALIAEVATDYDERTSLTSFRVTAGWLGGVVAAVIAYVIFLVPTEEYGIGILNKEGYENFALVAIGMMVVSMLLSALSTHSMIPNLPKARPHVPGEKRSYFTNLKTIFANPSFRSLFIASLFSMMAFGVIITLQVYFATFFFGLETREIAYFPMMMVLAALLSLAVTPLLSRGIEKKKAMRLMTMACLIFTNIPIILRMLELLPENRDPVLLPLLLFHILISTAAMVAQQSLLISMTADLVEDTERETGHRVEGLYFAAASFCRKIVSGLGIFASGVFLSFASDASEVLNADIMMEVAYLYVPFVLLLYAGTYLYINRYRLSRQDHEDNLRAVSEHSG